MRQWRNPDNSLHIVILYPRYFNFRNCLTGGPLNGLARSRLTATHFAASSIHSYRNCRAFAVDGDFVRQLQGYRNAGVINTLHYSVENVDSSRPTNYLRAWRPTSWVPRISRCEIHSKYLAGDILRQVSLRQGYPPGSMHTFKFTNSRCFRHARA